MTNQHATRAVGWGSVAILPKESNDEPRTTMTAREDARALVDELKTVLGPLLCGLGEGNPPGVDDPVRLLYFATGQLDEYAMRAGMLLLELEENYDEDAP